jgi:poly(A) polymerase
MHIEVYLGYKPEILKHPVITAVSKAAKELGTPAYLIGGYVRDLLLNRPSVDMDFVCEGSGIALAQAAAHLLKPYKEVHVFKSFGTAHFVENGLDCEFVGARKESYRAESRKPIVEDGSIADDQNRRDFTIMP